MTQRRIYQSEYPYFVTTKTKDGIWLFDSDQYARRLSREIFKSGRIKGFDILSYQVMPDYLHLLIQYKYQWERTLEKVRSGWGSYRLFLPTERMLSSVRSGIYNEYNISNLIQLIKGNFSRKIHQGNIWQKRFYTRIITNRKYLEIIIHYIKYNPIKAKLPSKYQKMPYQYFDWIYINCFN